jgi:hypothetical protein
MSGIQPQATDLFADIANDAKFIAALQDRRFAAAVVKLFSYHSFVRIADGIVWNSNCQAAPEFVTKLRDLGESAREVQHWGETLAGVYPDDKLEVEHDLRAFLPIFDDPSQNQDECLQKQLHWLNEQLREIKNNTNSDVFEALRAHLARLGWRTENAADRALQQRRKNEIRVEVLREVKRLEAGTSSAQPLWATRVSKRQRISVWRRTDEINGYDPEVRETYDPPGLERRLDELALSGRIAEAEYDRLQEMLEDR